MTEVDELKAKLIEASEARREEARKNPDGPHGWLSDLLDTKPSRWDVLYGEVHRKWDNLWHGWYWRKVKNRYQRGKRGWGCNDWWELANYLNSWLPDALRHLKENSQGYPCIIFGANGERIYGDDLDANFEDVNTLHGIAEEDRPEQGEVIWADVLEKMALAFEADAVLMDWGWMGDSDAERRLKDIRHEGMRLFMQNYPSLWD